MVYRTLRTDDQEFRNFIQLVMDNELKGYDEAIKRLNKACDQIPTRAATVAVNFVKERFRKQNWLDETAEPWQKRKRKKRETKTDKRAVLVKSGRLMRSWRKITANATRAIIGTDVPYAQIHNTGGRVKATANIGAYNKRGYRRAAHTRKRNGVTENVKAGDVAAHVVKAHRREVNFVMPRRQFIGQSATLNNRIQDLITSDITKAITG